MIRYTFMVHRNHLVSLQDILKSVNGWFDKNPEPSLDYYLVSLCFNTNADLVKFQEDMSRVELVVTEKVNKISNLQKFVNRVKLLLRK